MKDRTGFEFETYLVMLKDPDYADYTGEQFAEAVGVKKSLIYEWNYSKVDWEAVKTELRSKYAKLMPKVDRALFKATQKGDVPAIRTYYERFDAWTPASKVLNEQVIPDKELDEAIDALAKLARENEAKAANVGEATPTTNGADAVLPSEPGAGEVHQ